MTISPPLHIPTSKCMYFTDVTQHTVSKCLFKINEKKKQNNVYGRHFRVFIAGFEEELLELTAFSTCKKLLKVHKKIRENNIETKF